MNRGTISPDRIHEQALDLLMDMGKDEEYYYYVVEKIKESIDDIAGAYRKITYALIAQRLQLYFPGITANELYNTYKEEITAYSEQYD
jgi:hypothetical protein